MTLKGMVITDYTHGNEIRFHPNNTVLFKTAFKNYAVIDTKYKKYNITKKGHKSNKKYHFHLKPVYINAQICIRNVLSARYFLYCLFIG